MGKAIERLLGPRYRISVAGSARDALRIIEGDSGFDVILCDLMMPEMTGMDLHAALHRSRPELAGRMVFMTGGAYTDQAQDFLERLPDRRLDKPFRPDEVERALAGVLRR